MTKESGTLAILASVVGIVAGLIAVYTFLSGRSSLTQTRSDPPQAIAESSTKPVPKDESALPSLPPNILEEIGPGTSIRYVERLLGVPKSESQEGREYEVGGYAISVETTDVSVKSVTLGPALGKKPTDLVPIELAGRWGEIKRHFGDATFGDFNNALSCEFNDWTWGGNAACTWDLSIECGGSHANNYQRVVVGINAPGCYSTEFTDAPSPFTLGLDGEALLQSTSVRDTLNKDLDSFLQKVADLKINYIKVTSSLDQ